MRGRKALDFIFLRPAMTRKNFGTFGLVALLFAVYTAVGGGKRPELPQLEAGSTFGSVRGDTSPDSPAAPVGNSDERSSAESVIGIQPSDDESERIKQIGKRGRLFDPETPDDDGEDRRPIDKDGLVQGVEIKRHRDEWMMLRSEKRKSDTLAAIEDRIGMKRRRKTSFPQSLGDPQ